MLHSVCMVLTHPEAYVDSSSTEAAGETRTNLGQC